MSAAFTTVDLDSLTASTSYTYEVYKAAGCSSSDKIADVSFTTLDPISLTAGAITQTTATLTIANHTGNWYHKESSPGTGTCSSSVSTSSASLSNLTADTSYTWKAYSDSSCNIEIASETFSTLEVLALNVSNIRQTTATLTISGYTDRWSFRQTAPTMGVCNEVVHDAYTANLSGLSPSTSTSYTFKAYSDIRCMSGGNVIATRSFTTLDPISLTADTVTQTTATLTIANHTGNWYHKESSPGTGTCSSAVSTSSASLPNLTASTTYTWKAYSDSGCSTEIASETFSTLAPTLTASAITETAATLTIAGHTGNWYHKKSSPGTGTCSSDVSTTSATLSSLTGGTTYTWKAYSDSSCNTEIASETFSTVGLSAASVADVTAKLRLVNWTADWWYKRTDPTGGTCTSVQQGTYEVDLASLTASTNYTYEVYSASGCNSTNKIADVDFTTTAPAPRLDASAVTSTGATLTLANYTSAWKYQSNQQGNPPCVDVAAGTAAVIADLDPGTEYTYYAYSAAGCPTGTSTIQPLDTATFTTLAPLTASAVKETSATLTIANHTDNWYHKESSPGTGTCTHVTQGTDTATLSSLTGGTTYTWKAYSDNSCSTEIASETFSTVGLTATSVAQNTATLNLSNWSAQWWYKKTAPTPAGTCSLAVAANTLTADLASLTASTDYTYEVYSAAGCNSTNKIADMDFTTTAITLEATVIQQTTATLTLTGHMGTWGHAPKEDGSGCEAVTSGYTLNLVGLTPKTDYTWYAFFTENCRPTSARIAKATFTTRVVAPTPPPNSALQFPANAATDQSVNEDEAFSFSQSPATDADGDAITYTAVVLGAGGSTSPLPDDWLRFKADTLTFFGTPLEQHSPATLTIQVTASDGRGSRSTVTFNLTVVEVNDPPEFVAEAEDQTAKEGEPFSYVAPIAKDPDHEEEKLVYSASVEKGNGQEVELVPGDDFWLDFDPATRTFSGTPGRDDAPRSHEIVVKVEDPEGLSDRTDFTLTVETVVNSRLLQVAKQWLARFGRTVSSQVVDSITDRMGEDAVDGRITVNGQTVSLSDGAASREAAREAREADDSLAGLNGADPFATAAPSTKEAVDDEPVKATATTRDILLDSSFRLPLNPVGQPASATANTTAAHDGSDGATGSVASATTAPGGGGWMVWGEAALTNFDSTVDDLRIDGEVLTGVAALDWERDRWLVGVAVSQSEGDGSFDAPATDVEDAIKGTVSSSLTAVHPYVRYRPSADLEFWGVAGYGRGTMTLDAEGEDAANPDIWLTTIGVGGRAALLRPQQTGGAAVDLTADALLTRTGAAAAGSLRDGVEASTTRLRLGVETSWNWQGAEGTSVVPTLSTALRYDAGDAETGLGVEVGAGVAYANPNLGLTLSADVRGLLSHQEEGGDLGLREWGGSGSIRFDRGGDDLGLTVALSPSWGVTGSRADQLWSEAATPFPTAKGADSADGDGDGSDGGSGDNARLESEVGYGFAAFSGNAVITPYAALGLSEGTRDWRIGSRFSFLPGLDISIEGTRRENRNAAPEHGIRLDLNTTW